LKIEPLKEMAGEGMSDLKEQSVEGTNKIEILYLSASSHLEAGDINMTRSSADFFSSFHPLSFPLADQINEF